MLNPFTIFNFLLGYVADSILKGRSKEKPPERPWILESGKWDANGQWTKDGIWKAG